MSSQPMWEQVKSARISRSGLIGLGAGIGLGLVLGLLIGWVWWPVEWQGGAIGDMATAAQMEYMATVAEAYAGSGTPAAASRASARMAQLGPVTAESLVAAMEYFAAQPESNDVVRNLATLSVALGMPVDVAANPVLAQAMAPTAAPELSGASSAGGAATNEDATPAAEQEQGGINGWAVLLLFGLLVAAGGAYIIYLMQKQRSAAAPDTISAWSPNPDNESGGAFAEEVDYPGTVAAGISFGRSDLRPTPTAAVSTATSPVVASSSYGARGYSTVHASPPVSGPPGTGPSGFDPEDDTGATTLTSSAYFARPADEADANETPDAEELDEDVDDESAELSAPGAAVTAVAAATPRAVTPLRFERYAMIETHSAVFHAGMANVDFMRNIEDDAGRYIGEYGMFVHERNGLLNGNLEDVIAFEVTLIDKADEQPALTTLARTLLSEYAHDKLYEKFAGERQSGGGPITAQKDASFHLEGSQLLLECTIAAVSYSKEGIFRSLTVDMVLRRRT